MGSVCRRMSNLTDVQREICSGNTHSTNINGLNAGMSLVSVSALKTYNRPWIPYHILGRGACLDDIGQRLSEDPGRTV